MRIVVTGAAGFIGSHLVELLVAEGHEVVAVDNLLTGSLDNLQPLLEADACTFLRHDVTCPMTIEGSVDWVLHLASPASPVDYLRYPLETLAVGSSGTRSALDLALAKRSRFLLASTSEVYGDPLVHPQPESYWGHVNPIGPRSVYDESKRFSEALTMAYHRAHGLDIRIVRVFNTYGPRNRVDDGRVVPTFINQALRNEPLTIFGEGTQTRSFQYVTDLLEGMRRLMDVPYREPVNLGNPVEFTVREFADKVLHLTGSRSRIVHHPLPEDDPKTRKPDITRARELLGWEPKVTLDVGLPLTIAYYRALLPQSLGTS